ncbi:MAG: pilus assembly protein TadG-related protein, partial [Deltaproteobacteria bacterium]
MKSSPAAESLRGPLQQLRALSRDERGTISILSVITIFVLTFILGMVINAGREVDEKIRLQNAADAAAYSGGAVIARGLNALAFSNHVEAEVFALVAYLRAGRDAGPGKDPTTLNFENSILDAWDKVGGIFAKSSFPKFAAAGPAIQKKVPLEKDIVKKFLTMTELQSKLILGPLESILRGPNVSPGATPDPLGGVIPRFQRAVVLTTPQAAQLAASEIARLHGSMTTTGKLSGLEKLHGRQPLIAILWRTNVMPVNQGNEPDPRQRTLPVFDPSPTGPDASATTTDYLELARCQRRRWAQYQVELWNRYLLAPFFRGIPNPGPGGATSAKMSALYW